MRPPQRSRASSIVTSLPARASSRVAIRPAAPAPITTKCVRCRGDIDYLEPGHLSQIVGGSSPSRARPFDRLAAGVRRIDRENPAGGTGKLERIVDPAAPDWRWRQALPGIVAMRRVDIVDHQVER